MIYKTAIAGLFFPRKRDELCLTEQYKHLDVAGLIRFFRLFKREHDRYVVVDEVACRIEIQVSRSEPGRDARIGMPLLGVTTWRQAGAADNGVFSDRMCYESPPSRLNSSGQ